MGLIAAAAQAVGTLDEGQTVVLTPADTRGMADPGLPCAVVAISRVQVALLPLRPQRYESFPATVGEVYLGFRLGPRSAALHGVAAALAHDDLRFYALDGVQLCQRRATRLRTNLEVSVEPEGATALTMGTIDVSASGALLDVEDGIAAGLVARFELRLDDGEDAVTGTARTVNGYGGRIALDFTEVDGDGRQRLDDHIIAAKRTHIEEAMRAAMATA
jgi:hypothetical protein